MRLELTNTDLQSGALAAWRSARGSMSDMLQLVADSRRDAASPDNDKLMHIGHFEIGTEGEIRTLETSLEDSDVSSYITSAKGIFDF